MLETVYFIIECTLTLTQTHFTVCRYYYCLGMPFFCKFHKSTILEQCSSTCEECWSCTILEGRPKQIIGDIWKPVWQLRCKWEANKWSGSFDLFLSRNGACILYIEPWPSVCYYTLNHFLLLHLQQCPASMALPAVSRFGALRNSARQCWIIDWCLVSVWKWLNYRNSDCFNGCLILAWCLQRHCILNCCCTL